MVGDVSNGLLAGHRAIITGGGSGIGAQTALRFAAAGAAVAILDRDLQGAERVRDEILAKNLQAHAFEVDVSDGEAVESAVQDAAAAMGGISVLFNNAGFSSMSPIHEYPLKEWDRIIGVNLSGVFHGMRAAIPFMLEGGDGRIISTSSISATRPSAGESPYSAAKAGVIALTANAALEYGPTIRVNSVSPGMIRSTMTGPLIEMFPEHIAELVDRTPVGRIGEPGDIADVVVFLASDLARFINGQNIVIDGGMTLHGAGVDGVMNRVNSLMNPAP